jgi:hypothetical protein
MRLLRGRRSIVLALLVGAVIGTGVARALTTTTVVADTNTVRERIATMSTDGNFDSGWHIHPGPVIVQVQRGYLKITQATCHPNVVGPGKTYIETPGVPVDATADNATSWTITELIPNSAPGAPDRVPTTSPCTKG